MHPTKSRSLREYTSTAGHEDFCLSVLINQIFVKNVTIKSGGGNDHVKTPDGSEKRQRPDFIYM